MIPEPVEEKEMVTDGENLLAALGVSSEEQEEEATSTSIPVRTGKFEFCGVRVTCPCVFVLIGAIIGLVFLLLHFTKGESAPYQAPKLVIPLALPNGTAIWLGNGCFWERQYAYVNIELNCDFNPKPTPAPCLKPFNRSKANITSKAGYAGGFGKGLACYHSGDRNDGTSYELLGHAEVVEVELASGQEEWQFKELIDDYFASFTQTANGMARPDEGDHGSAYRSVIGLPGGVQSELYPLVQAANMHQMVLEEATQGTEGDVFNHVWVMDSDKFPFQRAEQYHQFHSNFFGPSYPNSYIVDLWHYHIALGTIPPTGCPEQRHW
eukprot:gb/GEZN01010202.1/.p1 GENE.gb/GEZN01010202.1/~~gb/GEZN01010202.1/.p1  ORF type:complete len:323 (+),score=31.48 gb/GEZN01010202.1/:201-1169(+)